MQTSNGPSLALFDFDGTVTDNDNFTAFIKFASGRRKLAALYPFIAPVICGYRLGIISPPRTREIVAGMFFKGMRISDLVQTGEKYSETVIPSHIRKKAADAIAMHKERGDTVVIVSASLDIYLSHWCAKNGLELLCTGLETKNGIITGKYSPADCSGSRKAERVLEKYSLSDFSAVYAYGDSFEDRELLSLAHMKYYRWQETGDVPLSSTPCDTRREI